MMKYHSRLVLLLCASTAPASITANEPGCDVPPPNCAPQPQLCHPSCAPHAMEPESSLEKPEGAYVRGPESGEFAGPAQSIGVRGFGIRLPEIRIDFPEVRLPHLVRYRRNPEMLVESSRAPYVKGPVTELNQVPTGGPENKLDGPSGGEPESNLQPNCVPPAPAACGARERRLAEELARKEAEIQEMNQRFSQLERMVTKLAERELAQQERAVREVAVEEPEILPSAYERPAPTARPTNAARPASQAVRQEVPVRATRRTTVSARSTTAEGGFGDWNQAPAPVESAEPSVLGVELRSPFE